uniref:Uncharacterized protein n=1 Tax=Anopheles merus TaxID=30066 RepID=A0A182V6C8_ANOME
MFAWQYRILLLVTSIMVTVAIQANFERLEQPSGKEYVDYDLRVRKFNRTAVTLNGTININQIMDNTMIFSSNTFLSRLGNQQFQHYPMHLPTHGLCELIKHLHGEYTAAIEDIVNVPSASECPIEKRAMYVPDKIVPMDVIPDSLSSGLWKLVISGELNDTIVIRFMQCILLCLVAVCSQQASATLKASYERFEQFLGHEYIDFDLRVRKFNRTTMTLNGTINVNQPIDDTIQFASDVFLSRLGNQQFQHYPQHLPTSGICEFIDHLHEEYPAIIADIVSIPDHKECPVSERAMHVVDMVFPSDILPESLSSGLWKMVITALPERVVPKTLVVSVFGSVVSTNGVVYVPKRMAVSSFHPFWAEKKVLPRAVQQQQQQQQHQQ